MQISNRNFIRDEVIDNLLRGSKKSSVPTQFPGGFSTDADCAAGPGNAPCRHITAANVRKATTFDKCGAFLRMSGRDAGT